MSDIVTPDQPQAVPDMVLVPREPTQAMLKAGFTALLSDNRSGPIYAAMLVARPVLPVETPAEGLRQIVPLVWEVEEADATTGEGREYDGFWAGGYYHVSKGDGAWSVGTFTERGQQRHVGFYATLVAAKAAAQADYEARVSACFTSTTPTPLFGRDGSLREDVANCCHCGRIVDTREEKDGGDKFGAELNDGRWTCSIDCWDAVTLSPEDRAALAAVPPETAEMEGLREADNHRVIREIGVWAENVAFAAGVGSLETAGQIVSFLWARPSLMADFMAGKLDAVDTGLLDHHNGVLSWHGMDGGIHRPDPSKARFPAPPREEVEGKPAT